MNESEQRREASKHEDGVVDLISNMPDAILLLILSRLNSTEEAIQSSILSKRWRHLWTAIPSLDLNIYGRYKQSELFKEFVYWVLFNRSVDLDCFRLSCSYWYSMSTVEQWIRITVMRNVKQLDLFFSPEDDNEDIVMPHCLMTCASLVVLRLDLRSHRLILPSFSGFPALRVLTLDSVELFDDDLVNYFLESCCPLLEDLTFVNCILHKLDLLCISCPNLKKLRFCYFDFCCLKLSCPKLMCLELIGNSISPMRKKPGDMLMPHCLPSCASVEVSRLNFGGHRLIWSSFFGFPALRVLNLENVELFNDDLLNCFLESCPLLEDLTFHDCIEKLGLLCISSHVQTSRN